MLGYELVNWQEQVAASEAVRQAADPELQYYLQLRAPEYQSLKQVYALTLFIGLFVSLLFFIVQGSMLYLKLFTELADTKRQLFSLNRIGLTKKRSDEDIGSANAVFIFCPIGHRLYSR